MINIFESNPLFVSDNGVKWWSNEIETKIIKSKDIHGISLENTSCWYTEFPDGERNFVLVEDGEVIYEAKTLEGIGSKVDLLKFLKKIDNG